MEINCTATVKWFINVRLGSREYGTWKQVDICETKEEALKRKEELEKVNVFDEVIINGEVTRVTILDKEIEMKRPI